MTHKDVWDVIEVFAKAHGKTVSGLAKISGLDATTFNRSKRFTKIGQERWLSTNSIAKVLIATDSSLIDMMRIYMRHLKKINND
jgi:phage repressor protein C with HTH and peptisase S24 domain